LFVIGLLIALLWCACYVFLGYRREMRRLDSLTLEGVSEWVEGLLKSGRDRAFVVITDIPSGRFVQLMKYISGPGCSGIRMDFPRAPWSLAYYDAVKELLTTSGVSYAAEPTDEAPVTEVIVVDFHQDSRLAFTIVKRILIEVFGLASETKFRLRGDLTL
jgi:hypothetical protein